MNSREINKMIKTRREFVKSFIQKELARREQRDHEKMLADSKSESESIQNDILR